jgi:hypothetical protein
MQSITEAPNSSVSTATEIANQALTNPLEEFLVFVNGKSGGGSGGRVISSLLALGLVVNAEFG